MLDLVETKRLSAKLISSQFFLILESLSILHKAGIAHGSFSISNVLLNHGLIPHLVDFSCSWTVDQKQMNQEELQHLDPLYVSEELRAAFKTKETIPMSLERAKS